MTKWIWYRVGMWGKKNIHLYGRDRYWEVEIYPKGTHGHCVNRKFQANSVGEAQTIADGFIKETE